MMHAKRDAMDAARNVFNAMDGDGFNTNIGGRIYSRWNTPEIQPDEKKPWGWFMQQESPSEYVEPGNSGSRTWRATGMFFFPENAESDPMNTSAAQACDDFEDDVWAGFRVDPTLGGLVLRCNVISVLPQYGVADNYAEVKVILEFEQQLDS